MGLGLSVCCLVLSRSSLGGVVPLCGSSVPIEAGVVGNSSDWTTVIDWKEGEESRAVTDPGLPSVRMKTDVGFPVVTFCTVVATSVFNDTL